MGEVTFELPDELYRRLEVLTARRLRSVEDLIVEAVEDLVKRFEAGDAFEEAFALNDRLKAKYGVMPDSTREIRRMREELAEGE